MNSHDCARRKTIMSINSTLEIPEKYFINSNNIPNSFCWSVIFDEQIFMNEILILRTGLLWSFQWASEVKAKKNTKKANVFFHAFLSNHRPLLIRFFFSKSFQLPIEMFYYYLLILSLINSTYFFQKLDSDIYSRWIF